MRPTANPTTRLLPAMLGVLLSALTPGLSGGAAHGQAYTPEAAPAPADSTPPQLKGVDMDYKLGDRVTQDLVFTDFHGERIKLADLFDGERPVVLQLGYYECPMLCGLVFQGLEKVIRETSLELGDDYRVVTVSIDPAEQPSLARMKRQVVTRNLQMPEGTDGWHFMVGESHMIQRLADEVGFGFRWVRQQQQFAHPAVIMILSPDGTITRYLSGINYEEQTFRMSLVEASEGKVGSLVDQFLWTCLHYDPSIGKYSMTAMGVMRIGGALTVAALATVIGGLLWRERCRRARTQTHTAAGVAAQG
jgi:protein SCO1/2